MIGLAAKHRIPANYNAASYVQGGGLMSYGANRESSMRSAASLVDKILRGARAGDLPIERTNEHELWINRKTANALGLPQTLLLRADQVIE